MTKHSTRLEKSLEKMHHREKLGPGLETMGRQESESPVFFSPHKTSSQGWGERGVLIEGDRRRSDFGWWAIYRSCNIQTHT